MKLSVCPFSVVVFFGTAALFATTMVVATAAAAASSTNAKEDTDDKNKKDTTTTTSTTLDTTQSAESSVDLENVILPVCDVVFVLGAPGVGKGTQCQLITEKIFHSDGTTPVWVHISAGDVLRAERAKTDSLLAKQINDCIAAGQLVQSSITCQLITNVMKYAYQKNSNHTKFLIDGFPRSHDNATCWNESSSSSIHNIVYVVDFVCPEEILTSRLLQRGISTNRADDTIETIRKRFITFQNETKPILEYYKATNPNQVITVNTDQSIENVYKIFEALIMTI